MGVRGLQTFIEQYCPVYCRPEVNIEKLVEDYKKANKDKQPTIVFDGTSCLRFLYGNLDWVCGGQFKEFLEKVKTFVNAFKELGVHCVWFFGGAKPDLAKRQEWVDRSEEKLKKVHDMFDKLKYGLRSSQLDDYLFRLPTNMGFSHYFKDFLDCEVHIVVDYETEIAHFAKQHQCLAIFGQDTDFIILEGAKYYLSAKYFSLETMTTVSYDRDRLATYLGIEPAQFPVFATLAGNRFIGSDYVKPFHKSICPSRGGVPYNRLFPALGQYVRRLPKGEAIFQALPAEALKIFHDSRKSELLKESILSYSFPAASAPREIYSQWDSILQKAEELHKENINTAKIYNTLIGRPFRCSVATEDLRKTSVPPSARLLRPLRQNLYGILLKEKPDDVEPHLIHEWCNEGPRSLRKPIEVNPQLPSGEHPGLLALWGDDRGESMQTIRWKLFTAAISSNLNHANLTSLPTHLILPTAALVYLVNQKKENALNPSVKLDEKVLTSFEVEALLATAIMLPTMTVEELAGLPSYPVDLHAVQIATVFMRTLTTAMRLLNACGFPLPRAEVFKHAYFDGKLFQKKYREAKEGLPPQQLCEDQEIFRRIKQIMSESEADS